MDPPSTSTSLTQQTQMTSGVTTNLGNTSATSSTQPGNLLSPTETVLSPGTNTGSLATSREEEEDSTNQSSDCKSPGGTRCCNSLVKYESIVSIVPSASESFDTYLAKKAPHHHHHHHQYHTKHKHGEQQEKHHQCCQCKHLKRASQSLDTPFSVKHDEKCVFKRKYRRKGSCDVENGDEGVHNEEEQEDEESKVPCTRGAQSWRALRAVVAYYCSLRKIKREDN